MKVSVIRAFLMGGIRQEPGATLDLPEAIAREMLAMNKAVAFVEPEAVQAAPAAEATAKPTRTRGTRKETQ